MSRHTPGPWNITKHGTPDYAPQFGIYTDGPDFVIVRGGKAHADAALIAAAPELLAILREIVGQDQPNRWGYDAAGVALSDNWRRRAREAIVKAEE